LQVDLGFGDALPSRFTKSLIPSMLSCFSGPELLLYPLESVIAEKFQVIVYLGLAISGMKNYFDIYFY